MTGKARIIQEKLFSLSYLPCSSTLTHLAFCVLLPLNNCSANQAFSRASPSFKREGGERAKRVTSWKLILPNRKHHSLQVRGLWRAKLMVSHLLIWTGISNHLLSTILSPSPVLSVHSLSKTKILMQLCRDGQKHSLLCFLNTNRFYALLAFTSRC